MFAITRRLAGLAVLSIGLLLPRAASGQAGQFQACTTGTLANCALIRLTNEVGQGIGGTNLFQIAIQNQGSLNAPLDPTSVFYLVLLTGQPDAPEIDALAAPTSEGGAKVDGGASDWTIIDTGGLISLSATPPDNFGIGGCVPGSASALTPQIGQTCDGQFITFSFSTTRNYNPFAMSIAEMDVGSGSSVDGNPADVCGEFATACKTTPITATPEPATMTFMLTGFAGLAGMARRRRRTGPTTASVEA